jgi:hypothetical protein
MPFSNTAKNLMLDRLDESQTGGATHISLHTADPGTTGANEATGGSPAYARKAATWAGASSGSKPLSAAVTFDVAAGTYTHYGLWDALTAGNFVGGGALSASETFAAQGQYNLTAASMAVS